MEIHLLIRNMVGMTKTSKVSRMGIMIAKRHGIIIVKEIDIKTLPRMERDCQMGVICRRLSEICLDTSEKTDVNQENTLYH